MIYTSYYSNAKNLNGIKISISLSTPKNVADIELGQQLGPDWSTLNNYKKNFNKAQYTKEFNAKIQRQLDNGSLDPILNMIKDLGQSQDVFLLCYEKPSDFCHRHLLADTLNKKRGFNITEYQGKELQKNAATKTQTNYSR